MYDILFRGKPDGGPWLYWNEYGILTKPYKGRSRIEPGDVRVETIGLCSGLKDKGGRRVFEGDIVKLHDILFVVEWNGAEYRLGHIEGQPYAFPHLASHVHECDIVGNIHDPLSLEEG